MKQRLLTKNFTTMILDTFYRTVPAILLPTACPTTSTMTTRPSWTTLEVSVEHDKPINDIAKDTPDCQANAIPSVAQGRGP